MKLIQLPLLIVIALALLKTVQRARQRRMRIVDAVLWVVLWGTGGIAVLFPDQSNGLAHALGVTRGADLVLYLGVVVLFYLVLQAHSRIEWARSDITELTRRLALRELPSSSSPAALVTPGAGGAEVEGREGGGAPHAFGGVPPGTAHRREPAGELQWMARG